MPLLQDSGIVAKGPMEQPVKPEEAQGRTERVARPGRGWIFPPSLVPLPSEEQQSLMCCRVLSELLGWLC